jgi:hypothetical protein
MIISQHMKKSVVITHLGAFLLGIFTFLIFTHFVSNKNTTPATYDESNCDTSMIMAARVGANIYLMDLWRKDYVRVNTAKLEELINVFRVQNGKSATNTSTGICKLAQTKADFLRSQFDKTYDEKNQMFVETDTMTVGLESQYSSEELEQICPECQRPFLNSDVSLNSRFCEEEGQAIYCDGKERQDLNLVENFPNKILKKWISDENFKKVLLKNATRACVAANGGIVVYAIDSTE